MLFVPAFLIEYFQDKPPAIRYATYWQFVTFAAMIFVAFVTPVQVQSVGRGLIIWCVGG